MFSKVRDSDWPPGPSCHVSTPAKSPFFWSQRCFEHSRAAACHGLNCGGTIQVSANIFGTEWKDKTPRFLFRGYNSDSGGGDSRLNTKNIIQPHAYLGTGSYKATRPGERAPWEGGKSIYDMDVEQISEEVNGHLDGKAIKSHFSSWAADFNTALRFAGNMKSSTIAVLDTAYCHPSTTCHHVPSLHDAGISKFHYAHEYLVYGPISGAAYCCSVPVAQITAKGLEATDRTSSNGGTTNEHMILAGSIGKLFTHKESHTAGPDLFFTVYAAVLGVKRNPGVWNRVPYENKTHVPWTRDALDSIVAHLSHTIEQTGLMLDVTKPLVNPLTYVHGFPQLEAMIHLLRYIEAQIMSERSQNDHRRVSGRTLDDSVPSDPQGQEQQRGQCRSGSPTTIHTVLHQ